MRVLIFIAIFLASVCHLGQSAETCPLGFWNVGCKNRCFCKDNSACNYYNGVCSNGCNPEYYNSTCSALRARLSAKPNVTFDSCLGVRISWNPWNEGTDPGDGVNKIEKYILIIKKGTAESEVELLSTSYSHSLSVVEGVKYSFRVKLKFSSIYVTGTLDGIQGPSSDTQTFTCTSVPKINSFNVKANGSSLEMTWRVEKGDAPTAGTIKKIQVLWAGIKYGTCFNFPSSVGDGNIESTKPDSQHTTDPGLMWTTFNVTLIVTDTLGKTASSSVSVLTGEVAPNGTVLSVAAGSVTETSATLTWALPDCQNRGGDTVHYIVNVKETETKKPVMDGISIKKPSHKVSGLTAGTTYTASIVFENKVGKGPEKLFNFKTKGTKPTISSPTTTTISVPDSTTTKAPTISPSEEPVSSSDAPSTTLVPTPTTALALNPWKPSRLDAKAVPNKLEIVLTWTMPDSHPSKPHFKILEATLSEFPKTVTGLRLTVTKDVQWRTTYKFAIKSVYSGKESEPTQAAPIMLLGTDDKAEFDLTVPQEAGKEPKTRFKWKEPSKRSGLPDVHQYLLRASPHGCVGNNNPKTETKTISGTSHSYDLTLSWACQWNVRLTPQFRSLGVVHSAGAAETNLKTGPGPVPEPTAPKVSAVTDSQVEVELIAISNHNNGPLTYYLLLETTSSAKRKRRAVTKAEQLGIPSGARIRYSSITFPTSGSVRLAIGNGSVGSANPPLLSSTSYTVYFAAHSDIPGFGKATHNFSKVNFKTPVTSLASWAIALIILLIVLILLLILLIVLILVWRRRSQYRRDLDAQNLKLTLHSNGKVQGHHHLPTTFKHWSEPERVNDARYLVLDPEYGPRDLKVEALREHQDFESFENEYKSLPWGLDYDCSAGRLPQNAGKNRNISILPYDHCRVVLDRLGTDTEGSDYINASYVDGYLRRRGYIAAQSPFDEATAADFWLMIYQCNVFQVVMLTEILEEATMKCTEYWPAAGCAEQYGAVHVTCVSEEDFAYHSVRTFHLLLRGGKVRGAMQTVEQFQFRGWPDHGVPDSAIPLLEFYSRVKLRTQLHMGPMLVHCGTGISRTAVFIALDSLLQQAIHENVVNVFKFCNKMRRARPNMIRTAKQYMFLYDLLFEALLATNNIVNLDVRDTLKELLKKNEVTGHSLMWEQHCILEKYTPGPPKSKCSMALLAENQPKNRVISILPSDEHRVRLFSGPASADYINAVFMDSLFAGDDIILTQIPSHLTMGDFWRMIYDHKVTCVVDMEPNHGGRDAASVWLPESSGVMNFGSFSVRTRIDSQPEELVTVRRAVVNEGEHSLRVLTMRPGAWDEPYSKIPADRAALVALVHVLLTNPRGPVVFVCLDGATRSGLAAVAFLCAERLSSEHFVDVFHTVRSAKQRRSQVIAHQDQYRFLFKFLVDYVRRYMKNQLRKEVATESLYGHLPSGDLESIYSHTQVPVLHTSHAHGRRQAGVHYRYASSELLNSDTFA